MDTQPNQLITDINWLIKQIQYDEWTNFKKIDFDKTVHCTKHDKININNNAYHYGIRIYKFPHQQFNNSFTDFVARTILSEFDIYCLYKQYNFDRHCVINNKTQFEEYVQGFYSDTQLNQNI